MFRKMKTPLAIIVILLLASLGYAILNGKNASQTAAISYQTPDDLVNARIGVVTGTIFDTLAEEHMENPEISYFSTIVDACTTLQSGRLDAVLSDYAVAAEVVSSMSGLRIMDQFLTTDDYALVFRKNDRGEQLAREFNDFLNEAHENGLYDELLSRWIDSDESRYIIMDFEALPAVNGIVAVATSADNIPFDFIYNNQVVGFDIELFYRFCEERGYGFDLNLVSGDASLSSVATGKFDVSLSSWSITEERKQSVYFSAPFFSDGTAVIIADTQSNAGKSFSASVKNSFIKTFISENRWKSFAVGLMNTLLITLISLISGTLVGFLLYMWYRRSRHIAERFMRIFSKFIQIIPEVLLLLILFYIVFGKSTLNGLWVSSIAFMLIVSVQVYGLIKGGVNAIDKGQMEAALALGYTPDKAFFRVIFPQALQFIMPGYKDSVISLIKSTAIVGYVAVQDLTKMSDIIRSRTFEPFMPLIATAVFYFLLAWIMLKLVDFVQKKLLPIRRNVNSVLANVSQEERGAK